MKTANAKNIMKALKNLGFTEEKTKGDHYVFIRNGVRTEVPYHSGTRSVPKGTINLICRRAGITKKELMETLY